MEPSPFADVLAANDAFAETFDLAGREGLAARHLLVLTCMDARLDPLRMLGLAIGDATVVRNAGARVTSDVISTIVVAQHLLAVQRVMVVAHTRCRMASGNAADMHASIAAAGGPDTRSLTFLADPQQRETLRHDVQQLVSSPYLTGLHLGGFLYDVDTGRLEHVC